MRVCEPKFGFVKVQISVLPEPAEVYYHVNPIFDLPSYLPLTLKTMLGKCKKNAVIFFRIDPKVQYVHKMLNLFYDPNVKQMQSM